MMKFFGHTKAPDVTPAPLIAIDQCTHPLRALRMAQVTQETMVDKRPWKVMVHCSDCNARWWFNRLEERS